MGGGSAPGARAVGIDRRAATGRLARAVASEPTLARLSGETARVWVVGGWVRDVLLGRTPKDFDLVATADTAAVRRILGRRGYRFDKRGVVTWRMSVDGDSIDIVDAGAGGLERDLLRRDLTVNAIAYELGSGELVDPAGGLGDLARRRLRQPRRGVFDEDPLRALRLARFVASLPGFTASPTTIAAARRAVPALAEVAIERVRQELDALLESPAPAPGLDAAARWGLRERLLPELSPTARCTAGGDRPDVWTHTLLAIDRSRTLSRRRLPFAGLLSERDNRRTLHWALLLHDISKPETLARLPDGRPSFHGHETLGAERAVAVLRRLRAPIDLQRRVERLVRLHLRPGHLADAGATPRGLARLARDAGEELPLLVLHAACDALGSGAKSGTARWKRLRGVLVSLAQLKERRRPARPLLDGNEAMRLSGLAPGPALGALLNALVEAQLAGEVEDAEQARAFVSAREDRS